MRRPVYLEAGARRVERDGPGLRIRVDGRADGQVPLRLASRVVARASVAWSPEAMSACLSAGIVLVLVRPDGEPLGYCLPARPRVGDMARRIDALEAEPGGAAAFRAWADAEERRAILALAGQPPVGEIADLRPERVRQAVLSAAALPGGAAEAAWRVLQGHYCAFLSERLLAHLLPPHRVAPAAGPIDLHGALAAAGRWDLVPALWRAAAHRRAHPRAWDRPARNRQRLVRQYEAEIPRLSRLHAARMQRLDTWLWERVR